MVVRFDGRKYRSKGSHSSMQRTCDVLANSRIENNESEIEERRIACQRTGTLVQGKRLVHLVVPRLQPAGHMADGDELTLRLSVGTRGVGCACDG